MPKRLLQILLLTTIALLAGRSASGAETTSPPRIEEEMWALSFLLPVLAYVVRPLGDGPFPLVAMNHIDPTRQSPLREHPSVATVVFLRREGRGDWAARFRRFTDVYCPYSQGSVDNLSMG